MGHRQKEGGIDFSCKHMVLIDLQIIHSKVLKKKGEAKDVEGIMTENMLSLIQFRSVIT